MNQQIYSVTIGTLNFARVISWLAPILCIAILHCPTRVRVPISKSPFLHSTVFPDDTPSSDKNDRPASTYKEVRSAAVTNGIVPLFQYSVIAFGGVPPFLNSAISDRVQFVQDTGKFIPHSLRPAIPASRQSTPESALPWRLPKPEFPPVRRARRSPPQSGRGRKGSCCNRCQ